MNVAELRAFLEDIDDVEMPVVLFDDNEGEYLSVRAYREHISIDTSWARYSEDVVVIEVSK